MQHAIAIKLRGDDPTQGITMLPPKTKGGFHTWTEEEITQFDTRHEIGSRARLAFALGLCWARDPQGDRALHQGRGAQAPRRVGDGEGQNGNKEWLTWAPGWPIQENNCAKSRGKKTLAPQAGDEVGGCIADST